MFVKSYVDLFEHMIKQTRIFIIDRYTVEVFANMIITCVEEKRKAWLNGDSYSKVEVALLKTVSEGIQRYEISTDDTKYLLCTDKTDILEYLKTAYFWDEVIAPTTEIKIDGKMTRL